jgi:hypothetical protein
MHDALCTWLHTYVCFDRQLWTIFTNFLHNGDFLLQPSCDYFFRINGHILMSNCLMIFVELFSKTLVRFFRGGVTVCVWQGCSKISLCLHFSATRTIGNVANQATKITDCSAFIPKTSHPGYTHGDQIGRIFAYWVTVLLWVVFFLNYKLQLPKLLCYLFPQ